MKTLKNNFVKQLLLVSFLLTAIVSCKDNVNNELSLARTFMPTGIAAENGETSVTLTWNASLFTTSGTTVYQVDVSQDSAGFSNVVFSDTTRSLKMVLTDDKLAIKQNYYARIKARGQNGSQDSKSVVSPSFKILGEQYLLQVADTDIIDVAVILRWKLFPGLTKITLTPAGGEPFDVLLTEDDDTAGQKLIGDLTASTTYTADIYLDAKNKGTVVFKTKAPSVTTGNVIDLRAIAGKPSILTDTLPDIPSGSVVLLKRGESYTVAATFAISKSVTILSGLDFGGNFATIALTSNFDFAASSTVDSVVFKDVILKGSRPTNASFDNDYVINAKGASAVGLIKLENCQIKILRGVVRMQTAGAGTKVANYVIKNCVIDSIREYGVATASAASAFANISITNSTVYKARRFIVGIAGTNSITIQNCTFNELQSNSGTAPAANYFIDYNTFDIANPVAISGCIFGKIFDEAGTANTPGYRVGSSSSLALSSCFSTSDFVMTSNPLPSLTTYTGSSTAVFTDPTHGNFKVKDTNFPGKTVGDPRWR